MDDGDSCGGPSPALLHEWKMAVAESRRSRPSALAARRRASLFSGPLRPLPDDKGTAEMVGSCGRHRSTAARPRQLRRSETLLREQADLLDLTHDTVFVRDVNDVITYWNRGAEELYGWSREQALGTPAHQLLETVFPAPLEQIMATLSGTGRWEGELIHTKRDRTKVVVASRWASRHGEAGRPAAVLETNNDITERKQGEDASRTANLSSRP